jgi:hypothetical protein
LAISKIKDIGEATRKARWIPPLKLFEKALPISFVSGPEIFQREGVL